MYILHNQNRKNQTFAMYQDIWRVLGINKIKKVNFLNKNAAKIITVILTKEEKKKKKKRNLLHKEQTIRFVMHPVWMCPVFYRIECVSLNIQYKRKTKRIASS